MSASKVCTEILNLLGGQSYISSLMNPKMLISGDTSLGIRLKRANKNKINHIEITTDEDSAYKVTFWALPKNFEEPKKIAFFGNVKASELKAIIEKETNFVFQKGDAEKNKAISMEILNQLGGMNRINAMIGIEKLVPIENGISISFKVGAADNINTFEVVLDPSDTYTVNFLKVSTTKKELISTTNMIYFDMLIRTIEERLQCALVMQQIIRTR